MLEFVAAKLGEIRDDVVFLDGCTTGLFITDPEFPDIRYTVDVDCIVDVISLNQYHQLRKLIIAQLLRVLFLGILFSTVAVLMVAC